MVKKQSKQNIVKPKYVGGDSTPDSMVNECIFPIRADYFAETVDTEIPSVKKLICNNCNSMSEFQLIICGGTIAAICTSCLSMIIIDKYNPQK